MGKIIGIDLGTTNSAVCIFEDDKAKVIENLDGKRTTPSVIAFKKVKGSNELETLVGDSARRQAAANPTNTFYGVKRLIGRRFDDKAVQQMQELASYNIVKGPNGDAWVNVNGEAKAVVQISAEVLMKLKQAVEKQIGEEVTQAVITVPAYFNDAQRQATKDAGKIAGLEVLRIINEPTSAALAYGMDKKKSGKVAVYDLGGGTFDISILDLDMDEQDGSLIKVISTNGDTFLGGENFDEAITQYIVEAINNEHQTDLDLSDEESRKKHASTIQRIREAAENAKKELSSADTSNINLPFIMQDAEGGTVNFEMDLSRKQLEDLLGPLVERTLEPCKKALADAGLKASDLADVILVGGQTRMPLVVETVKKFFGKEPRRDVNPDEIVAMGAAVQGAILSGAVDNVLLYDVTPLTLGIRGKDDVMFKLIERNTSIPCKIEETFYTSEDNQEDVEIMVFQGEREEASKNKLLGKFTFEDLPPGRAREVAVKVCLSIDADGVIEVTATNNGRSQKVKIESNGGLTDAEIERMLADAEANKESDRILRETRAADAEADAELKGATKDLGKDYFKEAPSDLQEQLLATIEELTALRQSPEKSLEALVETTKKLKDTRIAIGDAFNKASETSSDGEGDAPEAADEQDNTADEGSAPKATKSGGPSL